MESIESKEQALVQHIKTAGLRQPKELALINEILEIRKERRQVFSALTERCEALLTSNNELTQSMHILKEQVLIDLSEMEKRLEKELAAQKNEFLGRERVLQEELALRRENQKLHVEQEVSRVKQVRSIALLGWYRFVYSTQTTQHTNTSFMYKVYTLHTLNISYTYKAAMPYNILL
ncbi:hypothetical protein EON63_13790 [archaeon]|nr:MAG: hypothetical protein EON63_13790 [archaeon]